MQYAAGFKSRSIVTQGGHTTPRDRSATEHQSSGHLEFAWKARQIDTSDMAGMVNQNAEAKFSLPSGPETAPPIPQLRIRRLDSSPGVINKVIHTFIHIDFYRPIHRASAAPGAMNS